MTSKNINNLFFKTAVHQCNDFVIITNAEAEIIYVNPAFEKHTGYKLKTIKGKNISIIKSGVHPKTFYKNLWAELKKGNPISKIFINKTKSGKIYYENKTITPIKNDEGIIEYYLSTSKDFSKEKENENKLKELNARLDEKVKQRTIEIENLNQKIVLNNKLLQKINSNLPAIVYLLNVKTKKITLINNTINTKHSFPSSINSEILFKDFISYFRTTQNKRISLNSFCNVDLNKEYLLSINNSEYTVQHKSVVFETSTSQKPLSYLGFINDISYIKGIQANLEESQKIAHVGSWVWNIKTNDLYWSDEIYKIFEIDKNNFKPSYPLFLEKIYSLDRHLVENAVNEAIEQNKPYGITHRIEPQPGNIKYVEERGYVQYSVDGSPNLMIGTVQDITESRNTQHRLEESQKLAKIGTWEVNLKTGKVYWSKEMYNVYDVSPDKFKLTFANLLKLVHSKDKQLVINTPKLAIETKEKYEIDYRVIDSKGFTKWVKGRGYAEFNSEGEAIRLFGAVQDITEEKRLHGLLNSAYVTLENSLSAIFTNDLKGKIEYANNAAVKMWGYNSLKEMLRDKPFAHNYWHPDDIAIVEECLEKVISTGYYSCEKPYRAIKKNGEIAYITFKLSVIKNTEEKPVSITGSFFDVTEELKHKKEIEENDRKLNLLLGNIDEVVYGIEVDDNDLIPGRAFFLSGKSLDIIGYTLKDIQIQPTLWYDSIHPDDYEIIVQSTIKAITQNTSVTREYRMLHRLKKEYLWFEDKITTYTNEKGQIIAYYGSIRDITERKKLDLLLIESEKKYRFISENNNHDLITLRDPSSKLLFVSNSVKKILGYEVEEYLNISLFDLIHPDDLQVLKENINGHVILKNKETVAEVRILHKDGYYIWLQTVSQSIYDDAGNVTKLVTSARDITERRRLEQELIAQEKKYRSIYENALVGIFRTNIVTQKPIEVNNICVELFGYDSKEDFMKNFIASEHYANPADRYHSLTILKQKLIVENQEILFKKKDGTEFWGNTSVKILPEENILEGVVIDVSLRKKYEEQLKKNLNEKDTLLKEIHHRVKNNLQVISSLLKLQLQKHTNPSLRNSIIESRERVKAIALIHEKMYLSEDISTINFSEYLGNLTKSVYPLYKDKRVNLNLNLEDYTTDINVAMPLGLACYEIISNSFKHAFQENKNGELRISVENNNNQITIRITDNGKGFSIQNIDPSKSLGWSLINNLSKQAKGKISVNSTIGKGTEFVIEL